MQCCYAIRLWIGVMSHVLFMYLATEPAVFFTTHKTNRDFFGNKFKHDAKLRVSASIVKRIQHNMQHNKDLLPDSVVILY